MSTVIISEEEFNNMVRDLTWLRCLEDEGVSNWIGIDYAQEIFSECYPDE